MSIWPSKTEDTEKPLDLKSLPPLAFQYFFRNIGEFKSLFAALTSVSVLSNLVKFSTVVLLGRIVSSVSEKSLDQILYGYIPLWGLALVCAEALDYVTRRVTEAFPQIYADVQLLRFYRALLKSRFRTLQNLSKERLNSIVQRYVGNIQNFLTDWTWALTSRLVRFCIVIGILAYQNPWILAATLGYIAIFLSLAFRLSSRFSSIANAYTNQLVDSSTVTSNFTLNLNLIRRLKLEDFFANTWKRLLIGNWDKLSDVRRFHSGRWFLQLNLFNFLYLATIATTIMQIKAGSLEVGYLVLIKWSFDELWQLLVYVIEYYVSIVQQREDWRVLNQELAPLLEGSKEQSRVVTSKKWSSLLLKDVSAAFDVPNSSATINVTIPELEIKPGSKVAVVGPSGSGKTTILNLLLGLVDCKGEFQLDGQNMSGVDPAPEFLNALGSGDPIFRLSLKENILLGKPYEEERLTRLLNGLAIDFVSDLEIRVGSPQLNLSTGQEQRIRLARTLYQESEIYLLDEPFAGLDQHTKQRVMAFVADFLKEKAVVLVTHNPEELNWMDKVYELNSGHLNAV